MKNLVKIVMLAMAFIVAVSACSDDTSTIGSSLIQDQVAITIDSTFTVTGHSVPSGSIQSRTTLQLLGSINARQYGTFSSDIVTQFMPSQTLVTDDVIVDSTKLIMRMPLGGYVGDSLIPMGVEVFRLNTPLTYPIYSNFDVNGKYDPSAPLASTMYTFTAEGLSDIERTRPYRYINIDMGTQFGNDLIDRYKSSPSTFATPQAFAEWFPGLYIRSSFGSGRVVQIDSTVVTLYYHQTRPIEGTTRDTTIYNHASYLAVTPEIITNNNMKLTMSATVDEMAAAGEPIIVAPTGYDVTLRFPGAEIIDSYHQRTSNLSVINSLTFSIPVSEIANDYGLTPPPYILMVKTSEKDEFFKRSKLPDNITSFYASYDSYNRCYTFSDMRDYILKLLNKEEITDDDMSFTILPVTVAFENNMSASSSYYYYYYYYQPASTTLTVASVTPYVNKPAMARLDLEKSKIVFTYSVQNINF